jgi:hypothetical protein
MQAPQPGETYLAFDGDFDTEPGWIGDDPDPEHPAGREVGPLSASPRVTRLRWLSEHDYETRARADDVF